MPAQVHDCNEDACAGITTRWAMERLSATSCLSEASRMQVIVLIK